MDQHSDHQPADMIPESTNMTTDLLYHPTTRTPHRAYHPTTRTLRSAYHPYARTHTDNHLNSRAPRTAYNTTEHTTIRLPELSIQPATRQPELTTQQSELLTQLATRQPELSTQPATRQPELPTPPSELPTQPATRQPELSTQPATRQPELSTQPAIRQPDLSTPPSELPTQPATQQPQLPTPPPSLPTELTEILSTLASDYTDQFSILLSMMPPAWASSFTRVFTRIHTLLPPVMPSELTISSLDMSALPSNFPTLFSMFKNTLMFIIATLFTDITLDNMSQLPNEVNTYLINITMYRVTRFQIMAILNAVTYRPTPDTEWEQELVNLQQHLCFELFQFLHMLNDMLYALLIEDDGHPDLFRLATLLISMWSSESDSEGEEEREDAEYDNIEDVTLQYVHETRGDDVDKCSVCLMEMEDGDNARRLRCLHAFHKDCIDRWLEEKTICPLCRSDITATQ